MVQTTFKWKYAFFSSVILFDVFANSSLTSDTVKDSVVPKPIEENEKVTTVEEAVNATRDGSRRQYVRPGQILRGYEIEITVNEDSFDGRALLDISLSFATREDKLVLHATDLFIKSVKVGLFTSANTIAADFYVDDELLYIEPPIPASSLIVFIEYSGQLANDGRGLHLGKYNQNNYLSMNLHPSYASRVFPCMDELTEMPMIRFKFNNLQYSSLVSNSLLEENSANQFRPLAGPPCLRGMIAHNFINVTAIALEDVLIYGRPGILNDESVSYTRFAVHYFYFRLNHWTNKEYTGIVQNQDSRLHIFGLPDVSTDWNALSIIGLWEPYLFMDANHEVKLQTVALPKIAEAIAKQWFGYVIYPQNRRYEWVVSGLASYAGWEMMRIISNHGLTQLDANTLFVTDVIQESLLRDSYSSSKALEPEYDLFEEDVIRDHIGVNGILKYKAPALMRMMRTVLSDAETDFIQLAAQALLRAMALDWVNSLTFIDAVNSEWFGSSNHAIVGDFGEFLKPWIQTNGYPLLHVSRVNSNAVVVFQESFGFSNQPQKVYKVPITYTTSNERNFSDDNIYPVTMLDSAVMLLNVPLGSEDWVLFNIQGQGYYRVNYEVGLWERIIKVLENPETRNQIHPLNRATLVDDALNIARAGKLDYDIAFRLVLTMEHETEYAPWKAFVRNMDFLRKRLVAYTRVDEDLDSNIYLRMIKKTIRAFEEHIGFYPDMPWTEPMLETLTRSLVMDHACRANYQPCITAAEAWFYGPNNTEVVNPAIPHDIRPAVYCTMVREGDEKIIEALNVRLELEPTLGERLIILESLACSQDGVYINRLLEQTIASNSPYGVEERVKIFAAVAGSSYANANLARHFLRLRTSQIRKMYGGPEKLEEVIFILADNIVDEDLNFLFSTWVYAMSNNLQDSQLAADRALEQIYENLLWDASFKKYVYSWIVDHAS